MGETVDPKAEGLSFLQGGGDMGRAIREMDWASTSLGRPESWPQSLRSLVGLMLGGSQPLFLAWGPDRIWLYNDAFTPILGNKHPEALGSPSAKVWAEAWDVLAPLFAEVYAGHGVHMGDFAIELDRRGALEEARFSFSYTPARDESGAVAGLFGICTETTAQIVAARRLSEEREQFAQLFEKAPTFMAMLRASDYRIELANPGYRNLVGGRDVVGKTVAEALPEAVEQGFLELLDTVRDTGEPYIASGRLFSFQAAKSEPAVNRYVDFVYQPIRGAGGEVVSIFVEGADVTARVEAEAARAQSEARLAAALSSGEGIGAWDWYVPENRVFADERFARLFGVDPERAKSGAPIAEFFEAMHRDDLPQVEVQVAQTLKDGGAFIAEYRLVQPDGALRWVRAQGWCELAADATPQHFQGVGFDITDRKRVEARQATLLELADALRDITEPGEIAQTACRILGGALGVDRAGYGAVDPIAETIIIERDWNAPGVESLAGVLQFRDYGRYIDDLKRGETVAIDDARRDRRTADTALALEGIGAVAFVNMPLVEQGRFVALLYVNHGQPRAWSGGDLLLMRAVAERVRIATERARAEAALQRLNETLEQQVASRTADLMTAEEALRQSQKMEAVGQLTGGIAHDFNNLLAGISGSLELLERRLLEERFDGLERYIKAAQSASTRAAALTQRLLAFSRRQTLDPRPTDINRLAADMEEMLRRTVGPDVEVEVVQAGGLWLTRVDASQLENALLNLCINARDAMSPKGGRLTVETANKWLDDHYASERDLPAGQYVSLSVTDTGSGMAPDIAARAFDPFFTTKPMGQGTGLGLSMIYGFVRQSGGQVRIYSEVGEGTTVCLYLPRHRGGLDDAREPPRETKIEPGDGKVVLVIDDEPTVRMLIVETLSEHGYLAMEAADGPTGLGILESDRRIDLLVTDVGLPGGLNGRQVADAARRTRPDLRVLFITGYAENAVIGNGHLDPGMEVITKPFVLSQLAAKIRDLVDS
jgi:signal transduction histidine kinase